MQCSQTSPHTDCRDPFSRFSRITSLLMEAERELDSLKCELVTQNPSNSNAIKDLQRRLRRWEWKAHLLKRMKSNYEQASQLNPKMFECVIYTISYQLPWSKDDYSSWASHRINESAIMWSVLAQEPLSAVQMFIQMMKALELKCTVDSLMLQEAQEI